MFQFLIWIDETNLKFRQIENEMDIRIESIVSSVHKYRDDIKEKLGEIQIYINKK